MEALKCNEMEQNSSTLKSGRCIDARRSKIKNFSSTLVLCEPFFLLTGLLALYLMSYRFYGGIEGFNCRSRVTSNFGSQIMESPPLNLNEGKLSIYVVYID